MIYENFVFDCAVFHQISSLDQITFQQRVFSIRRRYKRKSIIPMGPPEYVGYIVNGLALLYSSNLDGTQNPPVFISHYHFIDYTMQNEQMHYELSACEDIEICWFHRLSFLEYARDNLPLMQSMLWCESQERKLITSFYQVATVQMVRDRIYAYLCWLSRFYNAKRFRMPGPYQVICGLLGVSRETFSNHLQKLEERGRIKKYQFYEIELLD